MGIGTTYLSGRIMNLGESETLAMAKKSRELLEKGIDVINLGIGEPDFNTPIQIKEAAKQAIDDNYSHYPPVAGYLDLRQAISFKLKRDNNLDYKPSQIVVSGGAKQSLANAILCLVNPGDEVILASPYWVSYKELVRLAEGEKIIVEGWIENKFKLTPEQLEAAITPKTKLFIFNSPNNPAGCVYSKDEMRELVRVLERHPGVYIISDEIYEHIIFNGKHESIAQFDVIRDRVIVVNGLSKGFAMTGWRLGFMAANPAIAAACEKLQGQYTSGTNSIAQRAAIAAFNTDPATCEEILLMQTAFRQRRDLVLGLLNKINGFKPSYPDGAFYVFIDVSELLGKSHDGVRINTASQLCDYLLDTVHVALVPGVAFGAAKCIRLSYATSEELLRESCQRIYEAIQMLS